MSELHKTDCFEEERLEISFFIDPRHCALLYIERKKELCWGYQLTNISEVRLNAQTKSKRKQQRNPL